MVYEFIVPGEVVGKGRPRLNTYTGHVYTPRKDKRLWNSCWTIF
jgi:hypothetical protein